MQPAQAETLGKVGGLDPKRGIADLATFDEISRLIAERRGPEALALYDRLESRAFAARMLGASAALRARQPERAEQEVRLALAMAERVEPMVVLGDALMQQGRFAEARASFDRATTLEPESSAAWTGLACLAEAEGATDEAVRLYEKVRKLPISHPEALWRPAALRIEAGRRDEARALLAEIPPSELRTPDATLRVARAEQRAGNAELARVRIDGALREYPTHETLWLLRAAVQDQAGDLRAALAARREALRLAPDRPEAQNAVAWTLARLGEDLPEADAQASRAIAALGRRPALLDTLAWVRLAEGRYSEALSLADERLASAAGRNRVDLLYRRAEALAGLGRDGAAEDALALAAAAAADQPPDWSTWAEATARVRLLLDASG